MRNSASRCWREKSLNSRHCSNDSRMNVAKRRRTPIAPASPSNRWKLSCHERNSACTSSVLMDRILQQQSGKEELLAYKRAIRDMALQRAAEAKARLAGLEERHRAAATALERINRMVAEVRSRIEALESQLAAAAAEKQERESENVRLAEVLIS